LILRQSYDKSQDLLYLLGTVYICHGRRAITSSAIFRTVFGTSYVAAGYGVCVHIIHDYRAIFCADSRGLIGTNPYGGCTEIVRQSCNFSAVTAQSPQAFYGIVRSACGFRAEAVLYGDMVTVTMLTISWNMAGSILRYDLKSPRDSRINSCIRVSKCPRVTRLSSHGFTQTVLSLRLSLLFAALPERPGLQCTPAPFYSPASTVI